MKKRFLAGMLVLVIILHYPEAICAEQWNKPDFTDRSLIDVEAPLSYHGETEVEIDSIQTEGMYQRRSRAVLEEKYISPYITSVKNQGSYGTCWAFSAVAASEASIVKKGLAAKEIDLSEWHLAYFLANSALDPLGGTSGDQFVINGNYLMKGANQQMAVYRLANWYGVVDEQTAPYAAVLESSDAALSASVAYDKDIAHLENSYWIAMKDQNIIKQLIKNYGACGASYCSESEYYNTTYPYNTEVAEYCPDNISSNHGITIVGWDDNYSREKFGVNKPDGDGAWYCKNSWGNNWGKDGYFWISYEDVPLHKGVGFFYDYGAADNYDHNYQYDGGAWGDYYPSCKYEANMYEAHGYEMLKAVGFYTRNAQYNCTISIYVDCEEGNPVSGKLAAVKQADQLYAGFHTVELDEGIVLNQDERFSVVICQTTSDGGYAAISVDSTTNEDWCSNISNAEAGQSFISAYGLYWSDISAPRSTDGGRQNCRIKAYTDNLIPVSNIRFSVSDVSLYQGENMQMRVSVAPQNAYNKKLEWSSSDEDVAVVSENGIVTGKKCGKAVITCKAADQKGVSGSSVQDNCVVRVTQPAVETDLKGEKVIYDIKGNVLTDMVTRAKYRIIKQGMEDAAVEYMEPVMKDTSVCIPAVVTIEGITYKVTAIHASAFKNNRKLAKVIIGNNVKTIGADVFKGCTRLKSITMGKNVTTIGSRAFYKCSGLTKVVIPSQVSKIEKQAFYGCKKLKNIQIKTNKLTNKRIGSKAFKGIHAKAVIKVPKKKISSYQKILKKKGIGKKVRIKK